MQHFQKLTAHKISWYHSKKPLINDERELLVNKFGFYEHHVASTQQGKTPRPKISVNKKYIYFVFHIPYLPAKSNKILICDLNIFITKSALITIESQGNLPSLDRYFETALKSKRVLERRLKHGSANMFLSLMKYILNELEELIDAQGEQVDALHKKIFKTQESAKFIEKISILRYNQVMSFSSMERQSRVMEQYSGDKNPLKKYPNISVGKWNDMVETFQTFSYELKADIDHLEGLVKTFETLVTHKTNETIKVLTIFSVVLLPLTLISGIYGMNFKYIPLANNPFGFIFTVFGMLVLLVGLLWAFKWKKWL